MPSIIYDFGHLKEAARLLEGADVHQPMASHMVGEYRVDYSPLTAAEIAAAAPELDALYANSHPVELDDAYSGMYAASDFDGA